MHHVGSDCGKEACRCHSLGRQEGSSEGMHPCLQLVGSPCTVRMGCAQSACCSPELSPAESLESTFCGIRAGGRRRAWLCPPLCCQGARHDLPAEAVPIQPRHLLQTGATLRSMAALS